MDQNSKIEEIAKKYNSGNAKPCSTPIETDFNRFEDDDNFLPNNTKFKQVICSVFYIATITRPDISAAINILSKRSESKHEKDWNTAKSIIRHLNCTRKLKII